MKSLQDLLNDYFSDGHDGHICSLDSEIPEYFIYQGKEYVLDFKNLDSAHTELMENRARDGLVGSVSPEEALELF
jgi:hypothetical protein